jgi:tripartite-type tricarboxylate transporter receptor subunit TctC
VRFVTPLAPGGTTDAIARMIAERFALRIGAPVVVDPRVGGSGIIAAEHVARAAPDGLTLLFSTDAVHSSLRHVRLNLPFDPDTAFAPIGQVSESSIVFAAGPAHRDLAAFIAAARERGGLTYGTWGVGSMAHLAGALIAARTGAPLEHVPFRGESQALTEYLAGRLDSLFGGPTTMAPYVAEGRMRLLGVIARRRSAAVPDVPTFAESGFPELAVTNFLGLWAPAGTDPALVARYATALREVLEEPEMARLMRERGLVPTTAGPAALAELVRVTAASQGVLIRTAGIRPE